MDKANKRLHIVLDNALPFFETLNKYVSFKVKIETKLSTHTSFDRHFTTNQFLEFILEESSSRFSGARYTLEGTNSAYEIGITQIIEFDKVDENTIIILEKYGQDVLRRTKLEFHKI